MPQKRQTSGRSPQSSSTANQERQGDANRVQLQQQEPRHTRHTHNVTQGPIIRRRVRLHSLMQRQRRHLPEHGLPRQINNRLQRARRLLRGRQRHLYIRKHDRPRRRSYITRRRLLRQGHFLLHRGPLLSSQQGSGRRVRTRRVSHLPSQQNRHNQGRRHVRKQLRRRRPDMQGGRGRPYVDRTVVITVINITKAVNKTVAAGVFTTTGGQLRTCRLTRRVRTSGRHL